jgi:hypothetical protein
MGVGVWKHITIMKLKMIIDRATFDWMPFKMVIKRLSSLTWFKAQISI